LRALLRGKKKWGWGEEEIRIFVDKGAVLYLRKKKENRNPIERKLFTGKESGLVYARSSKLQGGKTPSSEREERFLS